MRALALLLSFQTAMVSPALSAKSHQADDSEAAVMKPIYALVAGVRARDAAAVLATIRRDGEATIASQRPDGTFVFRHPTWDEFVAGIKPGPQRLEPRFRKVVVRVDGNIAMAWTPYTFLVDGKIHHCGVNHFDLVRENDSWKILNITYSIRTIGCGHS
jgi:hypothetical protein